MTEPVRIIKTIFFVMFVSQEDRERKHHKHNYLAHFHVDYDHKKYYKKKQADKMYYFHIFIVLIQY